MNTITLLIGKSGSGKSTIANMLESKYGLTQLPSFTTRPMREGEVNGKDHMFITQDEYFNYKNNNEIACSTFFNGNYYGATNEMLDMFDVYIIDKAGLLELQQNRKDININAIYIDVPLFTRIKRMRNRGDSYRRILSRLINDFKMFRGAKKLCDVTFENIDLSFTCHKISSYLFLKEKLGL